jgi:PAS domain S-box-containing protein
MQEAVTSRNPLHQGIWSAGLVLSLVAALLALHTYRSAQNNKAAREFLDHSSRVFQAVQQLETVVTRMEANQRGFLINGTRELERTRDTDHAQAVAAIHNLQALLQSEPAQAARVRDLEQALRVRYARMHETSSTTASQGLEAARAMFDPDSAQGFAPVQRRLTELRDEEQRRLLQHGKDAAFEARQFNTALALGAAVMVLLLLAGAGALWAQHRRGEVLRMALERSDATQRAILENAGPMIIVKDIRGIITVFNHAASQALGYAPADVIGRQQPGLFHLPQEIRARAEQLSRELGIVVEPGFETLVAKARRGETDVGRWTFVRRDGSHLRVQLAISAARDPEGQLIGFVGVAHDITEQERADERLRLSEQRVRTIIETASDAFIAIDTQGLVEDWNAQAERILGWSREEAIGRSLASLVVPPQHREAHQRGLRRYLEDGHGPVLNRRIEISALHRSGREFPIELTVWPLRAGSRVTFNAFIHDITARKAAQDSIRALNAELKAQADQLAQSNRELEGFSYSVSHDLRAPLRHMSGYAQMLREEAGERLDGAALRYLDEIAASARRMGALIDDLLAFSRLSRQTLTMLPINMNAVIRDAMSDAGLAQNPHARIEVGPLPNVQGDPILLKQVWVNLISNAVKYSMPRGPEAVIEINGERGEGHVRYRIRDNGVGFDPRYAGKLFGVFQRLHSQEEFEGTGVGLAIVQRIISRHRGQVGASAEPGRGAEFIFEIPVASEEEAAA